MLDPFTAFAAVKSGISLIEQGIKSGKQLHDMASAVSKWANAESSLDIHASNKGKGGVLSKHGLSSIEEDALAAHLRKRELNQKRKELRELFLLYCDNGLAEWESLQAEIARLRAKKKEQLRIQIKERKQIRQAIGVTMLVILIFVVSLMYGKIFKWF